LLKSYAARRLCGRDQREIEIGPTIQFSRGFWFVRVLEMPTLVEG
jgi:hypothetical protein